MATFGRGATKPQIPFVFLPLKGQIIYPSKEIIFTGKLQILHNVCTDFKITTWTKSCLPVPGIEPEPPG